MHPEFFFAAQVATHAHAASHPPLIVMVVGSLIAGVIITAITSPFRRSQS